MDSFVQTDANDLKVLGYLGRALSLELSAVQLYTTQARLVGLWGLDAASEKLRNEAMEEMQHVEKIISRMLALGVAPNASQLRPVKLGKDLMSLLRINRDFEMELVHLYQSAVKHCIRFARHDDRVFFQSLLEDEQHHADDLVHWMNAIEQGH